MVIKFLGAGWQREQKLRVDKIFKYVIVLNIINVFMGNLLGLIL